MCRRTRTKTRVEMDPSPKRRRAGLALVVVAVAASLGAAVSLSLAGLSPSGGLAYLHAALTREGDRAASRLARAAIEEFADGRRHRGAAMLAEASFKRATSVKMKVSTATLMARLAYESGGPVPSVAAYERAFAACPQCTTAPALRSGYTVRLVQSGSNGAALAFFRASMASPGFMRSRDAGWAVDAAAIAARYSLGETGATALLHTVIEEWPGTAAASRAKSLLDARQSPHQPPE